MDTEIIQDMDKGHKQLPSVRTICGHTFEYRRSWP